MPHCRFDDDISSTAQASLAAEGWPSGKQRQANRLITLSLCPPRQIVDSWILNSGAIAARWKAKAALPLRAATLKQQAMITRRSGKAASGKLVWNQHNWPAILSWRFESIEYEVDVHYARLWTSPCGVDFLRDSQGRDSILLFSLLAFLWSRPNYSHARQLKLTNHISWLT